MRAAVAPKRQTLRIGSAWATLCGLLPSILFAQSLTSGSLRGTVQSNDGELVAGAAITVEGRTGATVLSLTTDRDGAFQAQLLTPGEYRVLVEQIGFQPVRISGVVVTAGSTTALRITLERRPPPITSIVEITNPGARSAAASGALLSGRSLTRFDRPRDLSGLGRSVPVLVTPGDGRDGLGIAGSGLEIAQSRLYVDGVLETLLRHPGHRAEPASAPLFQRNALNLVQFFGPASDAEWRGVTGTLISAQSRNGAGRLTFAPYATFSSAKLGQNALDNPGDSTASSFEVGAVLSAAIVPDTAHIFAEIGYQSLQQPTAAPWSRDSSRFKGQTVSLGEIIPAIGTDSFQTELAAYAAPTVRTWKGGHGQGRLDWQLGRTNHLLVRLGFVKWKESNPQLGADLFGGAGTSLDARDLSGALSLTTSTPLVANELRAGFNMARRTWEGEPVVGTVIAGDGVAVGTTPTVPATFDVKRVDLSDALQYLLGAHRIKGGMSLNLTSHQQNYRFGAGGLYLFGDLDRFSRGDGTFFQVTGPTETAKFSVSAPGVFLEDTWSASPEIQIQAGLRWETQLFPKNRIGADTAWSNATGIVNNYAPKYRKGVSPRVGFVWNLQNRGEWVIRGSGGLYNGELDPSLFAEAVLFDGPTTVHRGQGVFSTWPAIPGASSAPVVGKRLTLFSPDYHAPRSAKFDFGISRSIAGGTSVSLGGSYGHTDYFLRRSDLNRAETGGRTTQDGRPVFGTLVKQGGLVTAAPKSNRRFGDYDLVSGLSATGFVDHYEITASLEHRVAQGLSLDALYTYGKTEDNLVGLLQPDPADQLDPFPDGLVGGGDWSSGRSDLDVPHRVAVSGEYRSAGKTPFAIGARWRWRSGLPFTPGFRPGVDFNGDGGGNNDPASIDQAGLADCPDAVAGGFAPRNSCRGKSLQALDLRVAIGLPLRLGGGGTLFFTIDAFNVVSSETGIVDRALFLVDPTGTLTAGASTVTVPLVPNPGFGTLLSRRVEPRLLRFGLTMEY